MTRFFNNILKIFAAILWFGFLGTLIYLFYRDFTSMIIIIAGIFIVLVFGSVWFVFLWRFWSAYKGTYSRFAFDFFTGDDKIYEKYEGNFFRTLLHTLGFTLFFLFFIILGG
jgi:hypothetical protein